ncbi:MAG: GntR family transcriptional regulator [Verrucomicrobia bacterium]|nr:GntR family transcriptional regulator [Verrucomicrobiota bacterium]
MSTPSHRKKLKRTGRFAEQAFNRLIEAILRGEVEGGAVLPETRLARAWKVGRTPLREAVRRAAEAGFVVLRSNQAPVVRRLTADDIRDLYDLRKTLELHALELAWPHFTPTDLRALGQLAAAAKPETSRIWPRRCLTFDLALHSLWMGRCGNAWLIADLKRHYQFLRIFQSWVGHDPQALEKAYHEHVKILRAIRGGDRNGARRLLRQHIRESARLVKQALRLRKPSSP